MTSRDVAPGGVAASEPTGPNTSGVGGPAAVGTPSPPATAATEAPAAALHEEPGVDLELRREELTARFAELQCDLGGLVYEMAIRDHIRVDVLVRRAAILQDVDAELGEVERILHMEQTGTAGSCASCGAPHSSGAVYCWQCGQPLLERVPSHAIGS
jgi:hypothetical protein